jgi:hypothetical protein
MFARQSITFLGFRFSKNGISIDESRFDRIRNLQPAHNIRGVKQLTGFFSYYRNLIRSYAILATPLRKLLQKSDKPFEWTPECTEALEKLKHALLSQVVLTYPDMNKEFSIITDASSFAGGAVLQQEHEGQVRPVAFASFPLKKISTISVSH